mmetsp:Transcript_35130/g.72395  ORF Transcript_35130/g.72395 Transcript_35130/m.72395 type:complete len:392 (-) Transcript_35130:170-1345(-)
MSDSDGEKGDGDHPKKDFMYKVKAFKRRTMHAVQKVAKKVEETKDDEYDEQFKDFSEVDQKALHLSRSVEKYIAAQKAFAQAGADLADDLLDMYNNSPSPDVKNLVVMLNHVSHNLADQIRPPLDDQWSNKVHSPVQKMLERFKGIKDDDERRKRYLSDYDHYRHKKKTLEDDPKQDKVAERLRETEQKLQAAGGKYFTMNERLNARLHIANEKKGSMLNEPLLSIIEVQNTFFNEGWKEINKIFTASKETKIQKMVMEASSELSRADHTANNKMPAGGNFPAYSPETRTKSSPRSPAEYSSAAQPDLLESKNDYNVQKDSVPSPPAAAAAAAAGSKRVKAMFSYEAAADTELDMKEDDIIKVIREDDSGWWQGEIDGRVGWFPFNYVEEL